MSHAPRTAPNHAPPTAADLTGTDQRCALAAADRADASTHPRNRCQSRPAHATAPACVPDRAAARVRAGPACGRGLPQDGRRPPPDATPDLKAEYPKGWDQSGSLRAPKTHTEKWPWCKFNRTIRVEVRTLDTWSQKHEPGTIDFIWADTQGAEADLVAGGRATLARTRFLYTEYSNDELYEGAPKLEALLDMLPGFEIVKLYDADILLRNTTLDIR